LHHLISAGNYLTKLKTSTTPANGILSMMVAGFWVMCVTIGSCVAVHKELRWWPTVELGLQGASWNPTTSDGFEEPHIFDHT
jgi:hypothetical protein